MVGQYDYYQSMHGTYDLQAFNVMFNLAHTLQGLSFSLAIIDKVDHAFNLLLRFDNALVCLGVLGGDVL